jgi:c-di-GMP-binding flagellar brake protein YcgR
VSRPGDSGFRIRVCAPITVAPYDALAASKLIETETVNLGAGGVLIEGATDWSPPEHAILTLSILGDDEPIEARAVLVACEGALCDFKYKAMDASARNRLGCFIIDHQRDSLRRRKAWYRAEIAGLDDDMGL